MQLSTEPSMGAGDGAPVGVALRGMTIGAPIVGWITNHFGPHWSPSVGAGGISPLPSPLSMPWRNQRRRCLPWYQSREDPIGEVRRWNFGNPGNPGTLIRTSRGDVLQHAPANVWSPVRRSFAGEFVVVGQTVVGPDSQNLNGRVLFVNDRPDAFGPWRTILAAVKVPTANGHQPCVSYSSALLPLGNGESILELAGAFPETGSCSIYTAAGPLENRHAQ